MPRLVTTCLIVALAMGASGSASSTAGQLPLDRSCPPGGRGSKYPRTNFEGALAQARRAAFGQRFRIQDRTYISSPQNTALV